MIKEVTAVGKDILEAKENARVALGAGDQTANLRPSLLTADPDAMLHAEGGMD